MAYNDLFSPLECLNNLVNNVFSPYEKQLIFLQDLADLFYYDFLWDCQQFYISPLRIRNKCNSIGYNTCIAVVIFPNVIRELL